MLDFKPKNKCSDNGDSRAAESILASYSNRGAYRMMSSSAKTRVKTKDLKLDLEQTSMKNATENLI